LNLFTLKDDTDVLGYRTDPRRSWRVNLGLGYTLSLGKKKRFYLNYEMAMAILNTNSEVPRLNLSAGIGFRLGTPASTTFEGVKEIRTVPMKP
jgi:hypothetical protein